MKRSRVLVVDDSATMRTIIASRLARNPQIEIAGTAANVAEADRMIDEINPDVITLDVVMPQMNGLDYLKKLLRQRPIPVIMVSSLTQAGARTSIEALDAGAFDFVSKPGFEDLADKVIAATKRRPAQSRSKPILPRTDYRPGSKLLAIGSSTGGVEALRTILSRFPKNCPPTLIVQHMPGSFTANFTERLNVLCAATVQEAKDGVRIEHGNVYVAPGGAAHLELQESGGHWRCGQLKAPPVNGHCPSVDVLFASVAAVARRRATGVILTGMGRDGAQGLLAMRKAGARTLGQDEASSVVYGMPKAAFELGAVERRVSLSAIGDAMLDLCALPTRDTA